MLYYEHKLKEILDVFYKYINEIIFKDDLIKYKDKAYNENIQFGLEIKHGDEHNFLLYEQYWVLLIYVLQGKITKDKIEHHINIIKAKNFISCTEAKNKNITAKFAHSNKPLLYFDYNVLIYLKKNIQLSNIKKEYQYVYSPAHIEELANSIRKNNFEYTDSLINDLSYLSNLTNNFEFLTSKEYGICLMQENPYEPLKRVIDDYNGTEISERLEKEFLYDRPQIRNNLPSKVKGSTINGILNTPQAQAILEQNTWWYSDYKCFPNKALFWEKYKKNHKFLFESLEQIVNVIEILDNNPEPAEKFQSHLHDVTHLIYATHSDIFVTNDKRLRAKANEIYDFLKIPCKVIDYTDFKNLEFKI